MQAMKTVKVILGIFLLALGSFAVQAEAGDVVINGQLMGEGHSIPVSQAIGYEMAGGTISEADLYFSFGDWRDHRHHYGPDRWCRDIVTYRCWYGRCREVVRTVCRDDRWRDNRHWYRDRNWHDNRNWHNDRHDRWRDGDHHSRDRRHDRW